MLDLFELSLVHHYNKTEPYYFNNLTRTISEDEVLIVDSSDKIFDEHQIYFWRKEKNSDILPAINCQNYSPEQIKIKIKDIKKIHDII